MGPIHFTPPSPSTARPIGISMLSQTMIASPLLVICALIVSVSATYEWKYQKSKCVALSSYKTIRHSCFEINWGIQSTPARSRARLSLASGIPQAIRTLLMITRGRHSRRRRVRTLPSLWRMMTRKRRRPQTAPPTSTARGPLVGLDEGFIGYIAPLLQIQALESRGGTAAGPRRIRIRSRSLSVVEPPPMARHWRWH